MAAAQPRSTFVTALAWVFIVLAGFATAIAAMQNLMIWVALPPAEVRAAIEKAPSSPEDSALWIWIANHIHWVFAGFLALCAAMLAAAIGLLRRANWARLLFIALLAFGIAWNVVGVAVMFWFFFGGGMPMPEGGEWGVMVFAMTAFNLLFVAAFVALFAWIIKRLASPEVRREFGA